MQKFSILKILEEKDCRSMEKFSFNTYFTEKTLNQSYKDVVKLFSFLYDDAKFKKNTNLIVKVIAQKLKLAPNVVLQILEASGIEKLEEARLQELKIADLTKNQGISDFTKPFKNELTKLKGSGATAAKLADIKYNLTNDYVTFIFLTERTPKYKDNFNLKAVDPNTWTFQDDNLYQIHIRFKGIFRKITDFSKKRRYISQDTIKNLLRKCEILIWSDIPSFQFQGSNYLLSQLSAAIHPTDIPPKYWQRFHKNKNLLDKHTQNIINSMGFWLNPMATSILKLYKKKG